MTNWLSQFKNRTKPYILIALVGVIGYLPVSSMMFCLKNDIIAIDFPIKYFISECLHNNIQPFWFNTWAMGFPLESVISWSIFSPIQFLVGYLTKYNLYILHLEFIFYIVLSGCTMFYFLKKHCTSIDTAWLLSCCYMLSGFSVGSSQWFTYITAVALLPLLSTFFLNLLKHPSIKSVLLFSCVSFIAFTSIYPAFTIIIIYILLSLFIYFLFTNLWIDKNIFHIKKVSIHLLLSLIITGILCSVSIYSTIQVLSVLPRGAPINVNQTFFNSNYLHPKGLLSLLVPLSTVKIKVSNTEGTMMNTYLGLFPLLLFPLSIILNSKQKHYKYFLILGFALLALLSSLGSLTPFRNLLNVFPGFSFFRNPGLFRLFFIFFFLIYIAKTFSKQSLKDFFTEKQFDKGIKLTFIALGFFFITLFAINFSNPLPYYTGFGEIISNLRQEDSIWINSLVQFSITILLFTASYKNKRQLFKFLIILELIINTLCCTPFFTVSRYSVKETEHFLNFQKGFPIQSMFVSDVPVIFSKDKARWFNVNVFSKKVSARESYWGPLFLKYISPIEDTLTNDTKFNHPVLFSNLLTRNNVVIIEQKPNYISAQVSLPVLTEVFLVQNNYRHWRAYFNNKQTKIYAEKNRMKIMIKGEGLLTFKYERSLLWISCVVINLTVLAILGYYLYKKFTFRELKTL